MAKVNDTERELMEAIASFRGDMLGYVMFAFPWGQGELAEFDGPDQWAIDLMEDIRLGLLTIDEAIRLATASGHGIGKSAFVAWLILWAMSTMEDTKGVVTANTETQLKTKTWPELAKWHRLAINSHWFTYTATALFSVDPKHEKTWRVDMVAWSERNTEAFAGLHNKGKRILLIFDEASAIPDVIWEVSEGALTDEGTEIIWAAFGNPTRNKGRFKECFGRFKARWKRRQIDSRTVKITNKKQIQEWFDDYGEDSDFFKVRVRGQFPSVDPNALISPEEVEAAFDRNYKEHDYSFAARILGVDVAREGMDSTVIAPRQGLVAFPMKVIQIPDHMIQAGIVVKAKEGWDADTVFIDNTGGYGGGVIDKCRELRHEVVGVHFAGKASDKRYFNKRSEIIMNLAQWIKAGGAMFRDEKLKEELCAVTYTFTKDQFRVCEKDEIKEEIGRSPDRMDALALTFAHPVAPRFSIEDKLSFGLNKPYMSIHEYNPLEGW